MYVNTGSRSSSATADTRSGRGINTGPAAALKLPCAGIQSPKSSQLVRRSASPSPRKGAGDHLLIPRGAGLSSFDSLLWLTGADAMKLLQFKVRHYLVSCRLVMAGAASYR